MKYLSVCSGIEAASVAWKPLGWECVGVAEIEKAPSAVLAHHYQNVPNFGDLTKYQEWPRDLAPDLVVGGTPCQSFSVAGLRAGLADPRGNLALVFLGLVDRYRPRWVVWENVPGVRSSGKGRDFGAFLGALGELGYGWAYRSLDAQYFGLAQRRERVFVVGCLGDWRPPVGVLSEPEGLRGDSAPRRPSREDLAPTLASRARSGSGYGPDTETPVIAFAPEVAAALETTCHDYSLADGFNMVALDKRTARVTDGISPTLKTDLARDMGPVICADIAPALPASGAGTSRTGNERTEADFMVAHSLRAEGFDASEDGTGRGTPLVPVAFAIQERAICENPLAGPDGIGVKGDGTAYTLEARSVPQAVASSMAVRRLTPRECERLQGFPDDYTLVPYRGRMMADGPRYKMLGNSMAVPVMAWIGRRIAAVDALLVDLERQEAA